MRAAFCVLFVAIACGPEEATSEDAIAACAANCPVQAQGEACDAEAVERECVQLCEFLALQPEACFEPYAALYACFDGEEFTCVDSGFTVNDVVYPMLVDPGACADEQQAIRDCTETTGS